LKRELESRDPKLHAWAESYGRFPALYFLQPWKMKANVRWFVDQYTQQVSLYPSLKRISFIGHSNGTFILSKMLEDYRQTRFHRILFAGSVVPKRFEWSRFRNRFRAVRNYPASDDYIVAALPGFFEFVPVSVLDVGSAGHNGFDDTAAIFDLAKATPPRFVVGGHSAAINARTYSALASFITGDGAACDPDCRQYDVPADLIAGEQKLLAKVAYSGSAAVWGIAALLVAGAIYWTGRKIGWPLAACIVIAAVGLFLRYY
jgi:pimeloyl-ACP methyl ester carboxylesterase